MTVKYTIMMLKNIVQRCTKNTWGRCLRKLYMHTSISRRKNRPPGGNRPLINPSEVFKYNNWDNVVWDEEQEKEAKDKVMKQAETIVSPELQDKYEEEADQFWDDFYKQHQNRFFKDRHWLFTEFPELASKGEIDSSVPIKASDSVPIKASDSMPIKASDLEHSEENIKCAQGSVTPEVSTCRETNAEESVQASISSLGNYPGEHSSFRILEVGCGVGNTVFPVLQMNDDPGLFVYCCDLSKTAIDLVKEHADYCPKRSHAFVCNVADPESEIPFPESTLDVIIFIFVLSSIHPNKMQDTINRLARYLKPGGTILFRDYGRYDMAQLRFKQGRCLEENFYVRGDGTRVYFFTQEEMKTMFEAAGLVEKQNLIDRRLQVNRGRQLKMYRVWIQCKYCRPES